MLFQLAVLQLDILSTKVIGHLLRFQMPHAGILSKSVRTPCCVTLDAKHCPSIVHFGLLNLMRFWHTSVLVGQL